MANIRFLMSKSNIRVLDRLSESRLKINWFCHSDSPPASTYGPRTLQDYQLLWIIRGGAQWTVHDSSAGAFSLAIPPGTSFLARPGMRDSIEWDKQTTTLFYSFHFDLAPRLPAELVRQLPFSYAARPNSLLTPLFEHLARLHKEASHSWDCLAPHTAHTLLINMISGEDGLMNEEPFRLPDAVLRVLNFAVKIWHAEGFRRLSSEEITAVAHCSSMHLSRLFKSSLDVSPVQALTLLRLEKAARLLFNTELRIQEVGQRTGFMDPYGFSRVFKTAYKMSPRAYREFARQHGYPAESPLPLILQTHFSALKG